MLLLWPTSLYEMVLAKGLLLILGLLFVTSCPVMIAAALDTILLWLEMIVWYQVWNRGMGRADVSNGCGQGFLMQFHDWSAVASISVLHPLTPAWYSRSVPKPVSHPASPSPHCWPQPVADTGGIKKVAVREPAVSFGDVLHVEEAGNPVN